MSSKNDKKDVSLEKIQVYQIIFSMFIQLVLVIAGLVAFFMILCQIFKADNNWTKTIYTVADTMLAGTIYVVYKHYFPGKK
jgi:hypothetical protein